MCLSEILDEVYHIDRSLEGSQLARRDPKEELFGVTVTLYSNRIRRLALHFHLTCVKVVLCLLLAGVGQLRGDEWWWWCTDEGGGGAAGDTADNAAECADVVEGEADEEESIGDEEDGEDSCRTLIFLKALSAAKCFFYRVR